jgi:uncharacterized protein YcbK (DUF882 family)
MGSRVEHWPPALIAVFEEVRARVNAPVFVSSGWRCPRHNAAIALTEKSQHSVGAAFDLLRPAGMRYATFYNICDERVRALTGGQGGVGRYTAHGFVHVDIGLGVERARRWGK